MTKVHPIASPVLTDRNTIILIGRNVIGKSSLGNAILGENIFSLTLDSENKLGVTNEGNSEFNIFDSSGIGDTGEDMAGDFNSVVNLAKSIVDKVDKNSVTAILFVLKYGNRFTKQEKDAVAMAKSIFGENVFEEFVIMAFSYGDIFEEDKEDGGSINERFKQWCYEQTGDVKTLFKEVNYRCVLFNKNAKSHNASLDQLRIHIESLKKIQTNELQVADCMGEIKTKDITANKECVTENKRSGCVKCCDYSHGSLSWLYTFLCTWRCDSMTDYCNCKYKGCCKSSTTCSKFDIN